MSLNWTIFWNCRDLFQTVFVFPLSISSTGWKFTTLSLPYSVRFFSCSVRFSRKRAEGSGFFTALWKFTALPIFLVFKKHEKMAENGRKFERGQWGATGVFHCPNFWMIRTKGILLNASNLQSLLPALIETKKVFIFFIFLILYRKFTTLKVFKIPYWD